MKSFNVNAKVKVGFNDKTKLDENGNPYYWEENEIIKDMDRARFEELKAKGYVEETKEILQQKDTNKWD